MSVEVTIPDNICRPESKEAHHVTCATTQATTDAPSPPSTASDISFRFGWDESDVLPAKKNKEHRCLLVTIGTSAALTGLSMESTLMMSLHLGNVPGWFLPLICDIYKIISKTSQEEWHPKNVRGLQKTELTDHSGPVYGAPN